MSVVRLRPNQVMNNNNVNVVPAMDAAAALSDGNWSSAIYFNAITGAAIEVNLQDFTLPAGAVTRYVQPILDMGNLANSANGTVAVFTVVLNPYAAYPTLIDNYWTGPIGNNSTVASQAGPIIALNLNQTQINQMALLLIRRGSGGGGLQGGIYPGLQPPLGPIVDGYCYEAYVDLTYAVLPVVSGVTPGGTITNTLAPVVSWTFTGDGLGQVFYRVLVYSDTQYTAGGFVPWASTPTWDSGDVTTSNTSVQLPQLANNKSYRVYVQAAQRPPENGVVQWSGATNVYTQFLVQAAPPGVPSAVTPVAGATVNTDLPTLGVTLPASPVGGATVKGEWQLATDAAFTANVKLVTEADSDFRASGATTEVVPVSQELKQGLWYLRARTADSLGQRGAYTASQTFTVAHAPATASWAPTGQTSRSYVGGNVVLTWQFQDTSPTDFQTAYEVIVEKDSDGSAVVSTGKVTSGSPTATVAIPAPMVDVLLRWRVRVYDSDDVVGAFSNNNQFYARNPPTVTVVTPADSGIIDTPTQAVTWTFAASAGRTAVAYKVDIYDGPVAGGSLVHTSNLVPSAATIYSFDTSGFRYILGHTYSVVVTVTDSAQLVGTDTNSALAQWTPPPIPVFTLDGTTYDASGYVGVNWTWNEQDGAFIEYRIYRRPCGSSTWVLLRVDNDGALAAHLYKDYMAPANGCLEYTMTQVATRFGSALESDFAAAQQVTPQTSSYWVLDPDGTPAALRLRHVVSDSFTDVWETAEVQLLARGRRIEYGTRYGYDGQLEVELWDEPDGTTARAQRLALIEFKARAKAFYLKNPFGDVWKVFLGEIGFDRIAGVSRNEYGKATIPYTEVSL